EGPNVALQPIIGLLLRPHGAGRNALTRAAPANRPGVGSGAGVGVCLKTAPFPALDQLQRHGKCLVHRDAPKGARSTASYRQCLVWTRKCGQVGCPGATSHRGGAALLSGATNEKPPPTESAGASVRG